MKDIIEVLSHAYTMDIITDVEFAQLVAEDDALRARVEQAERERDSKADSLNAWADLWARIVKRFGCDPDLIPSETNFDGMFDDYSQWLAGHPETLAPRRCGTCAQEAAKAMRDEAIAHCNFVTDSPLFTVGARSGARLCSEGIANIPLPSCDGCNPLKPEAAK